MIGLIGSESSFLQQPLLPIMSELVGCPPLPLELLLSHPNGKLELKYVFNTASRARMVILTKYLLLISE